MMDSVDSDKFLKALAELCCADEAVCVGKLISAARLLPIERKKAAALASAWIEHIRLTHKPEASVSDLLSRFGLTSQEGLALMCLAEALLRVPDRRTADALIRDKLGEAHWDEALGRDAPWTINAAGWALSITGKIIQCENPGENRVGSVLGKLISRVGQPVIREAIRAAMGWLADQFVTGETIEEALRRCEEMMDKGVRFSFDMLGEGARTAADATRYYNDYLSAIEKLGQFQKLKSHQRASGISVKLSALHPRYEMAQRDRVLNELVPRLVTLCEHAASYDIPLTIDAEEAERLQLSLEIIAATVAKAKLGVWQGLGFAVQSYQKRAAVVIDYLVALAQNSRKRFHIRLVKGAYWDTEIKRSQERGWDDFPVFTRKASTDVSYLACARRMLSAEEWINPVFGTHNAMTVAHILALAEDKTKVEFQRLHGMGEDLHILMSKEGLGCCVYAPVGNHDVLLGYLVRRILENGANSSFVHRLLDPNVSIEELTRDPVEEVLSYQSLRHPSIQRAGDLYRPERVNSSGMNLSDPFVTGPLLNAMRATTLSVEACVNRSPIDTVFAKAQEAFPAWSQQDVEMRSTCLERVADLLEKNRVHLMTYLVKEAGKTVPDALSELRESVDFCRYYAARARKDFASLVLPGPTGELNFLQLVGRGVFVCISPWNFPLAIFMGQISAALVAGNCVVAKPAPQTPGIARVVQSLIYKAGVPESVFQLCFGGSDVGEALVQHSKVAGVAFTGSTKAAWAINRTLASKEGPIVPLIAETGGQNVLIVDSSALPEQVVDDCITSSFRSAGQRCSALRVLYLPERTADKIITMLVGAMEELRIGDPLKLETDVGPVIDRQAQERLEAHTARLKSEAREIYTCRLPDNIVSQTFTSPQVWEIPSIGWLEGEVFGPILHIIRYKPENLSLMIAEVNKTGFGLTGGVHSRIESTARLVSKDLRVGNLYINRSIIGAVVGVQPFGGQGLSGTGPKAGGPHYLQRFAYELVVSNNTTAAGGNASLLTL